MIGLVPEEFLPGLRLVSRIVDVVVPVHDGRTAISHASHHSMQCSLTEYQDKKASMTLVTDRLTTATMSILDEFALVLHVTTCPFVLDASLLEK